MKKLFFVLFVLFSLVGYAQRPEGRKARFSPEKYKQMLEHFVTEKACLTKEEASAFFPVFHEMLNEQRTARREMNRLMREGKKMEQGADYQQIMERVVDLEIKQKEVEKSYYEKFSKVLSWEKMFKVKCAVQEFGMEALNRFYPRNPHNPHRRDRR